MTKISIIGGGAWGTALAICAQRAGCDVRIWAREKDVVADINDRHVNESFLPGVALDEKITATDDLLSVVDADYILLVTPTQFVRSVCEELAGKISCPVIICAKGIEQSSGQFLHQVVQDVLGDVAVGVLSGPSFARDAAVGLPTAVTVAGGDFVPGFVAAIGSDTFRPYISDDVVGVLVGGAVKNVLAIASGIAMGRDMGDNARAALIARGLSEMIRFAEHYGGKRDTMMGLSGLGDLVLTCSGTQSRNLQLGMALAKGEKAEDILGAKKSVAEGYYTAKIVAEMAQAKNIDLPICAGVHQILHEGAKLDTTIASLLTRPFTAEQ